MDRAPAQDTQPLRIAAVFIVLAAGLLGGLPPLWLRVFRSASHPLPRIIRALNAGIVLALALVHVMPLSLDQMGRLGESIPGPYQYNLSGVTVIAGILLMLILDGSAHGYLERRALRELATAKALKMHTRVSYIGQGVKTLPLEEAVDICKQSVAVDVMPSVTDSDTISRPDVRAQVIAVMFEAGCIFHSIIIGLTLGVQKTDLGALQALVIALCFHQWLEGMALGLFITQAFLPKSKSIWMVVAYSLTCPLGIAIGLGVSDSYDAEGNTALGIQGVFNGVSGGLLLYIGLVQLIAADFSRKEAAPPTPVLTPASDLEGLESLGSPPMHDETSDSHSHSPPVLLEHSQVQAAASSRFHATCGMHASGGLHEQPEWVLYACYAALAFGAGVMAVVGIWA